MKRLSPPSLNKSYVNKLLSKGKLAQAGAKLDSIKGVCKKLQLALRRLNNEEINIFHSRNYFPYEKYPKRWIFYVDLSATNESPFRVAKSYADEIPKEVARL